MAKEKHVFEPRVKRPYIGTYHPRTDAWLKATGEACYAEDLAIAGRHPNMVYMKILKSPYPNAVIKSADTSRAEALPGVVGILRYDDPEILALPASGGSWTDGTNTVGMPHSWAAGCFDRRILGPHAHWAGDEIGVAVAATSVETAEEALRLVDVEWEQLPFVLSIEDAMKPDAPVVHPEINPESNFIPNYPMWGPDVMADRGDVTAALAQAEVTVEASSYYRNPQQCALDYWNCMVDWRRDQILVISDSYAADQTRIYFHDMLNVPMNDIRVISPFEGGQHGRGNTGEQPFFMIAAVMSKKTGRPVRYTQTRKEHFHDTRTSIKASIRIGAKRDGTITAVDIDQIGNAGAYSDCTIGAVKIVPMEWIETMLGDTENVRLTARAVYTNMIPGSCMRSIGNVQMNYIFGLGIDVLAEKLGMDPVEILKKNITCESVPAPNECVTGLLSKGADLFGWADRHEPGKGSQFEKTKKRGIGMSFNNNWHTEYQEYRRGPTQIMIKLDPDGTVILNAPTVEVGGGSNTCAVLACAEMLGVPFDRIRWIAHQDTQTGLKDVVQSDSSVSFVLAEATRECALKVKNIFLEMAARKMDRCPDELDMKEGRVFVKADPSEGMTIEEYYASVDLFEESNLVPVTVMHARNILKEDRGAAYMAAFAEVEVDTETGEIEVLRLMVLSDGGTVLFPAGAEGQLAGGQCQGLGEALYEEMIYDEATGIPLNFNFVDYRFPTMADFPDVDPVPVEIYNGIGEYGCSGLGEAAPCCTPRAIANAVYNAIGIRINETAITPMKVLEALKRKQ